MIEYLLQNNDLIFMLGQYKIIHVNTTGQMNQNWKQIEKSRGDGGKRKKSYIIEK